VTLIYSFHIDCDCVFDYIDIHVITHLHVWIQQHITIELRNAHALKAALAMSSASGRYAARYNQEIEYISQAQQRRRHLANGDEKTYGIYLR